MHKIYKSIILIPAAAILLSACSSISEENHETITLPPGLAENIFTVSSVSSDTSPAAETSADIPQTSVTVSTFSPDDVPDVFDTADTADTYPFDFPNAETFTAAVPPQTSAPEVTENLPQMIYSASASDAVITGGNYIPDEYEGTVSMSISDKNYYPPSNYNALNYDIQHGIWISYLEYDSIMKNRTEQEFSSAVRTMLDNVKTVGINTVYIQVRAFGDAYYDSGIFPRGDRLTGNYDPLGIMTDAAHERGLSVHAWINPMRLMTDEEMSSLDDDNIIKQWYDISVSSEAGYMFEYGGRWYLDPNCDESASLICAGISEILTKYKVDGIQIDDYFYPSTDSSLDSARYLDSGTSLSRDEWRREAVSKMVRRMNSTVHGIVPSALFGISPAGNIENNYSELYADTESWCMDNSYCDYICPQLYYGFEHDSSPFDETAAKWLSLTANSSVKPVIGLAAYKIGTEDPWAGKGRDEWLSDSNILLRQIEFCNRNSCGTAIFRYDSLFNSPQSEKELKEIQEYYKQ